MAAVYRFPVENIPTRNRGESPNHPLAEAVWHRHRLVAEVGLAATQWDDSGPLDLARRPEAAPPLGAESRSDYSETLGLGWDREVYHLERSDGPDALGLARFLAVDLQAQWDVPGIQARARYLAAVAESQSDVTVPRAQSRPAESQWGAPGNPAAAILPLADLREQSDERAEDLLALDHHRRRRRCRSWCR
jgi:hypothetical protein